MAESKSRDFLRTDFLPKIMPSLLSSNDIHNYAKEGWLVTDYDPSRLLPAGYKLRFLGNLIQWELTSKGEKRRLEDEVVAGKPVTLRGNSIAYLHMEEEFRLPQYIAARFNLRITHVHQGLLLGTGPLVDPGFHGRLLVPLHNLTGNTYSFMGGESFIHVEFTKLSPLPRWSQDSDPDANHADNYEEFPKEKITDSPDDYFKKATVLANGGVVSNLAPMAKDVDAALEKIRTLSDEIKARQRRIGFVSGLSIAALLVLNLTAFLVVLGAHGAYKDVRNVAVDLESRLMELRLLLPDQPVVLEVSDPVGEGIDDADKAEARGSAADGEVTKAAGDGPVLEVGNQDDSGEKGVVTDTGNGAAP